LADSKNSKILKTFLELVSERTNLPMTN